MSIFSRIKKSAKGIDPFYEELDIEKIALYQHYFNKVINTIDVDNHTRQARRKEYDKQQMEMDEEIMEKIIAVKASTAGLFPVILQVLTTQYFFADTYEREKDKDAWVKRVMNRKAVDYFPSGWATHEMLEAGS